jgi:hypothetical protein
MCASPARGKDMSKKTETFTNSCHRELGERNHTHHLS